MNLLLTSVGRRVELVRLFRHALNGKGEVFATDMDNTAPGLYAAHRSHIVPPASSPDYIPALLDLCRRQRITAIVPLIDTELPLLAESHQQFQAVGTFLLVARPDVIETCFDKLKTAQFFTQLGVPTPECWSSPEMASRGRYRFSPRELVVSPFAPKVVKPRQGSASRGVVVCRTLEEVRYWWDRTEQPLIQDYAAGEEITTDVLCDLEGRPLEQVQRKRLKVRAGEVERGITVAYRDVADYAFRIAQALKSPGVFNVQCFLTGQGPLFSEVNPRFGGGYPLAHAAGARFPERIVQMLEPGTLPVFAPKTGGVPIRPGQGAATPRTTSYEVGVVMMRFDEAIYRKDTSLILHPSSLIPHPSSFSA
jgi:carbamoyl-phosphate synthase large subunit